MVWYYGEFSCGHEGRVNIIGPQKDRQWKIDNKFSNPCEECWLKRREEDREDERKQAELSAKEMELPNLTGSEKQIDWAITLRNDFISKFTSAASDKEYMQYAIRFERELKDITKEEVLKVRDYIIENETSSKFYIDNRSHNVDEIILKFKDIALKDEREVVEDRRIEKEIEEESLVVPENNKYNDAVEIKEENNEIIALFEKNDIFIEIVKELGYKWRNRAWRKEISEQTGNSADRIAELGSVLLNADFPVKIYNPIAKEKAINADFEMEQTRWIYSRVGKEIFVIKWLGKDDKLYSLARSIKGSRWDNGVTVSFGKYEEVEEFARLYDFKFTKATLKSLEEFKKTLKESKVEFKKVDKLEQGDGLKDILDSSKEILEDLIDD